MIKAAEIKTQALLPESIAGRLIDNSYQEISIAGILVLKNIGCKMARL
jgi:hypothetical protein